jgi:hypothetical protein
MFHSGILLLGLFFLNLELDNFNSLPPRIMLNLALPLDLPKNLLRHD